MPTTTIQHPTLERVAFDVPTESAGDWESAGWKVLDGVDTSAEVTESEAAASDSASQSPTAGPFTDTQGSDSPPETPATNGSTKTTRKAV